MSLIKIIKKSKTVVVGLLISCATLSAAHSELLIQEKEPEASIVNKYVALKDADVNSTGLHQLIAELNRRVSSNPNDSLAWELLAQIYYSNSYHAYAVYAANEAVERGHSTTKLKKILLNSSAIISQSQLKADYLTEDVSAEFLKEYQHALSKIYGEVYGFNYDESLPRPSAPIVRPRATKAKNTLAARRGTTSNSTTSNRKAQTAPKKKVVARPAFKTSPVKQPVRQAPTTNSGSGTKDPFKILR